MKLNVFFSRQQVMLPLGLLLLSGCHSSSPVMQKTSVARSTAVKTVVATPVDVERTTRQPATLHAYYRAEIQARASGFVKELKVDIGDYVEAGQTLAILNVPEMLRQRLVFETQVKRLQANESRYQAGIQLAEAKVASANADVDQARSQLGGIEASVMAAEAEFSRTNDMVQRGSLQNRMLDEVRAKRDSERANQEAFASSVASAEAMVAVAEAEAVSAEADLQAAKAETEVARQELGELDVMIDYATIRSPFAGLVSERNVEPGDLVGSNSSAEERGPLFVISQINKLRVRIPIPETDAPMVNVGDEVALSFPSFTGEAPLTVKVSRRSGDLDAATRTMMVEADLDNSDGRLIPGMFGQATIALDAKADANMLPAQAIRFTEDGEAYVYVVDENSTVKVASIGTGIDDGNRIEVLSGLEPQQQVIGPHLQRFVDGQKVTVLPN